MDSVYDIVLEHARTRWPDLPDKVWFMPVDMDKKSAPPKISVPYHEMEIPIEDVLGVRMGVSFSRGSGRVLLIVEQGFVEHVREQVDASNAVC